MGEPMRRPVQFRALNLPNILTYGRIAAAPLVGLTYYTPNDWGPWIAFAIFALASITDYFDGYFARIWEQQSALGRMLDPIADKLLVAVSILILVADGVLDGWSIWAAIIVLMREVFVSGLREFLAELRVSVPVTTLAKWKTTLQLVADRHPSDRSGDLRAPRRGGSSISVSASSGPAAIVTLYTGYDYFRAGIKQLVDDH
jgi:cardiolipin synthase